MNVDPNASIDELAPAVDVPPANSPLPPAFGNGGAQAPLGITLAGLSAAPFMMGDFFGGGLANLSGTQTVRFSQHARGSILSGGPGSTSSILGFEFGTDPIGNDVFTTGIGQDLVGAPDGADTFVIAEPLPTSQAPTAAARAARRTAS